ncbi:MAG TPA: DMT family transporter [Steroidobacteraceae bacterium]|nr:DMT family transporter [Steroidobacteraceae bacterium]
MNEFSAWPGAAFAVASAILFGISTPLAKVLLSGGLDAQLLAGLFYLGSGLGLSVVLAARSAFAASGRLASAEARLRRADLPLLCLAVLLGGVVAPVLMMSGLARTSAASAALLQNLEGLATMAIAWVAFRENVDRRLLLGAFAILAGAVLLSWIGGPLAGAGHSGAALGALLIAGACIAWGADNNLTRPLAHADPMQIAAIKGLAAGAVNVALAIGAGHAALPSVRTAIAAAIIGFLGYGVSLVLYVLGLRHLGAARTAAYFSTAPFIGAALAVLMLAEPVSWRLVLAGVLMAVGLYLHLRERHEHEHHHPAQEHAHRHVHDEHHQHAHGPDDPAGEPHSHWHRHEPLTHRHPHYPDLHHRHEH